MTAAADLRASQAYAALLAVSERVGSDPLQVQGPGGNSSLKGGGVMWVKASGTWLAEAREREIMTPVRSGALREMLIAGDPAAEDGMAFVIAEENVGGLRPSIETAVHAALTHAVVIHTHCIATIAVAARADAEAVVADQLGDLGAAFVPYVKPGGDLAREILARTGPEARVIVLGNHGLVACGAGAEEAEALLATVARRLDRAPAPGAEPTDGFAEALAGSGWAPAAWPETQAVALDPVRLALAEGGSLYPDHVVFLGPGALIARAGETAADAVARAEAESPARKLVVVPGAGVAIPADASPSMLAMARAFGDVLARIEPGVRLNRLDAAQEWALLNWDAEKHRQALEAARAAKP